MDSSVVGLEPHSFHYKFPLSNIERIARSPFPMNRENGNLRSRRGGLYKEFRVISAGEGYWDHGLCMAGYT